jgi:hypothetical protein
MLHADLRSLARSQPGRLAAALTSPPGEMENGSAQNDREKCEWLLCLGARLAQHISPTSMSSYLLL